MDTLPSSADIRSRLAGLTLKQLTQLSEASGVPVTTLYKIKRGETANPGIDTLRRFLPYVDGLDQPAAA